MPLKKLHSMYHAGQRFTIFVVFFGLVSSLGCRPTPTITKSTERVASLSEEDDQLPDTPEPSSNGERILGAFVPAQPTSDGTNRWWVFKLRGRPETIGKREQGFDEFLKSLRFPSEPGALPIWKLPTHWRIVQKAPDNITLVNIRTSHPLTPVDMTISVTGGELLDNINRWRVDQLDLPAAKEVDLPTLWRELKSADGKTIYRLDMKGPGNKKPKMAPFMKS